MAPAGRLTLLLLLAASCDGAHMTSELSKWMKELVIPIPSGSHFELPAVGDLLVESGECRGLEVGSAAATDNSTGLNMELGLKLSDVAVSCSLSGHQNGSLTINITLVNSSLAVAVRMNPWYPVDTPDLPLPLGPLSLTTCSLDMHVADTSFSGTAPVVALSNSLPKETLMSVMAQFIEEPVCSKVRSMVDVNGTAAFAQGQDILAPLLQPPPAAPLPTILEPTVDLRVWPPVAVVQKLINVQFPLWAGKYLRILKLPIAQKLMGNENVSISMEAFSIDGKAPVLRPGLEIMTNHSSLTMNADLADLQFQGTLGIWATLKGQPEFRKSVTVAFSLDNVDVGLNAFLNEEQMRETSLDTDMSALSCYVDAARSATDPPNGSLAVTEMKVGLQQGTEIRVEDGDALEESARDAVNTIIRAIQRAYQPAVSELINGGLGDARGIVNRFLWQFLDSRPACDMTVSADGIQQMALTSFWVCSIAIAGLALLAACFTRSCVRRARAGLAVHKSMSETSSETSASQSSSPRAAAALEVGPDVSESTSVDSPPGDFRRPCLALEPAVPAWLAVSYPILLLSCTFLFLYGDLALGATVDVTFQANGEEAKFGPVFSFSLINTIDESWQAGAYAISILTVLASLIWPFVKLFMLTVSWLAPGRLLSRETRGKILSVLDLAGKYSFLDSWFLVLTVSAFSLSWGSDDTSLKVEVHPKPAFYCFVLATLVSLVLGHVASEYHRYGLREERRNLGGSETMARRISTKSWSGAASLSKFAPRGQRRLVTGINLGTLMMAALACWMPSFEFIMGGLASQILSVPNKMYSLISVATALPESGMGWALVFLEIIFLLMTVVLPIILLCLMVTLWLVPLPPRVQDLLLHVVHVMDCWASMDVAALVLVVAAWNLSSFTEHMVRSSGGSRACGIVRDMTEEGCFEVGIHLQAGFVILLIAGVAMVVVPKVTHSACLAAAEVRNERAMSRKEQKRSEPNATEGGTELQV